jgi:hypothetical protein
MEEGWDLSPRSPAHRGGERRAAEASAAMARATRRREWLKKALVGWASPWAAPGEPGKWALPFSFCFTFCFSFYFKTEGERELFEWPNSVGKIWG